MYETGNLLGLFSLFVFDNCYAVECFGALFGKGLAKFIHSLERSFRSNKILLFADSPRYMTRFLIDVCKFSPP